MSRAAWSFVLVAVAAVAAGRKGAGLIDEARILPMDHAAIGYSTASGDDRVSRLQERLDRGEARLAFDGRFGYLPALLEALDVAVSSQALVFSKTSFQAVRIMPRIPRAIYHSPDTTVGFVRGGDVLELTAVDPVLGVSFYTLDQVETPRPRFQRRSECVSCHLGPATVGVPGLLVRSVWTERSGMPMPGRPSYVNDHRSPLEQRWGGWYLSGTSGPQVHMGNVILDRGASTANLDLSRNSNVEDLRPYLDTGAYLSPHSDLVSLMTLEHQTRMTNLFTRVGYMARIAMADTGAGRLAALPDEDRAELEDAIEELLRYLLFIDEAPLAAPVAGTSRFAEEFSQRGPRDAAGRSLFQLDLERRVQRYPLSFLIYSEGFGGLPATVRERIGERLAEILTAAEPPGAFAGISASDRRAVREILTGTLPEAAGWFGAESAALSK